MSNQTKETQVELYKAYSVKEILERREMFGFSSSFDSLSAGLSGVK
ncbi:MAG TPA: hypothetical protein VL332_07185 [Candidatus Saccharimonadaceae bacterium]|jgi:hypothetical protein|nr:hypothetical protein [Candidatus Saccharimonadaceae bacterium]